MPMPTYGDVKPLIRTVAATTAAPTGSSYTAAKLVAHGRAPSGDGRVSISPDAAKAITAYYYDRFLNKWLKVGATAALHTISFVQDAMGSFEFPRNALVYFQLDATTANLGISAEAP